MPANAPSDLAAVAVDLAASDLFSLLEPEELARWAPLFEEVAYRPGQVIAREGVVDASLWLVVEGMISIDVRSADGTLQQLSFGGYGTAIGLHGVFAGLPRSSNVVTVEPTRMRFIDREELWGVLAASPGMIDRLVLPDGVRQHLELMDITGAEEGEYEIARFRRHWVALAVGMVPPVLLLAAALAVSLGGAMLSTLVIATTPLLVLALAVIAMVVAVAGFVWSFFDYWGDLLVVTNHRIIDVQQRPLIRRAHREAPVARIQDVIVFVPNVWARFFGYGTLVVQTASTHGRLVFRMLPAPEAVQQRILAQVARAREEAHRERQSRIEAKVRAAIGVDRVSDPASRAATAPPDAGPGGARDADIRAAPVAARPAARFVATPLVAAARTVARAARYLWPQMREERGDVITWRKHWWVLVQQTWVPLAVLACSNSAGFLGIVAGWRAAWAILVTGWLVAVPWLLWQYEDWRNDLYRLTADHIIDIERSPFGLRQERREAALDRVQDARYVVPDPLANILGYGNVIVETAAEMGNFTFENVARPADVHAMIMARIAAYRAGLADKERSAQAEEWAQWLAAYHRLAGDAPHGDA